MNNFSDNNVDKLNSVNDTKLLSIENESLKRQLIRLTEENETLLKDIDQMADQLQKVGKDQKKHLELLELEVNKLKDMESKNNILQTKLTNLFEENMVLQKEIISKCEYIKKLEEKYKGIKEDNLEQRQKFTNLKERFLGVHRKVKNLKKCKEILLETQHEYAHSVSKWQIEIVSASNMLVEQLNATKMEKEILLNKLRELSQITECSEHRNHNFIDMTYKVMQLQRLSEEVFEQRKKDKNILSTLKKDNNNLIEKLSAQSNGDLSVKFIQSYDKSALVDLQKSYHVLLSRFQTKDREHTDLLNEIKELNDTLRKREDLILRQKEKHEETLNSLNKMRVLFKSFEEKLKKEELIQNKDEEIVNITKDVKVALAEVENLQSMCKINNDHLYEINEELHSFRNGNGCSTSTISLEEELSCLKEVEESFEEKYHKLMHLTKKFKKKLLDQSENDVELNIQKQENLKMKEELNNLNNFFFQMKNECEAKTNQLDVLKIENQKLLCSRKLGTVLNLEIEAAEKSLRDVTAKLINKTSELERLMGALASKENINDQLKKEISLLETSKNAEYTHSQELKTYINQLQEQLKEAMYQKQNTIVLLQEMELISEKHKQEKDEVSLRLSQLENKHESYLSKVRVESNELNFKIVIIKETLKDTKEKLITSEKSILDLRNEFNEYKLKAQSVLRKNQCKDITKERDVEEELISLRTSQLQLKNQLIANLKKFEESEQKIVKLTLDRKNIEDNNQEHLNTITNLRIQNKSLSEEIAKQINLQQETLLNHTIQLNNFQKYHKMEMVRLENKYQREILTLKTDNLQSKSTLLLETNGQTNSLLPDKRTNEIFLMEREDAEGSDEVHDAIPAVPSKRKLSNDSRRSYYDLIPLDELLNSSMTDITDLTTLTQTNMPVQTKKFQNSEYEYLYLELQNTRTELQKQECQVRHITTLLTENEQDLAKLTQMNHTLKEELRRQERGIEREKHMTNSEYLKNVILKFLTLGSSDERIRLVPVLNTILKLSPHELDVLNCVAKGQKGRQLSWLEQFSNKVY